MAYSRLIIGALMSASLLVVLPGFASAQRVHEVRPAAANEVRIAAESNASIDEVVSLARRLSHNETLTADDVVANNATAMQYSCKRPNGRQYYGNNPFNCAEGTEIWTNVRCDATYRIPRTHGAVLSRLRPRPHAVTQRADNGNATDSGRAAELQIRLEETVAQLEVAVVDLSRSQDDLAAARQGLAAAPQERARTGAALEAARAENARLTAKLAQRETPRPIAAPPATAGQVQDSVLKYGLIMIGLLVLFMALFFLWVLPREKKPLQVTIGDLEVIRFNNAKELEKLKSAQAALKTTDEDLVAANKRIALLRKQRHRLVNRWRKTLTVGVSELARADHQLDGFEERRDRIRVNHQKLIGLREEEDKIDIHFLHIREAERLKVEAERAGDEIMAAHNVEWAAQERAQIKKIESEKPGFVQDIKATIANLVAQITDDMEAQCGLAFDARASDEWKAGYQDRQHQALKELEAAKYTYVGLTGDAVKSFNLLKTKMRDDQTVLDAEKALRAQGLEALEQELAETKRNLVAAQSDPTETAKQLLHCQARIAEQDKKILRLEEERELLGGVSDDPSPEEGSHARQIVRPRTPTMSIEAPRPIDSDRILQPNDLQPRSLAGALNQAVTKLLDAEHTGLPRIIECNKVEAVDWAVLLGNYEISCPLTKGKPVRLRKFVNIVGKLDSTMLTERLRRKTDPPPAPASSNG